MFLRCSQLKRRVGRGVLGGIPPETRRRTPEIPFSRDFAFPNDRCHHSFGISNQVEIPRKTPQEDSTNIFGTLKGCVIVGYESLLRSEQVLRSWSILGVWGNSSRHRSVLFSVRSKRHPDYRPPFLILWVVVHGRSQGIDLNVPLTETSPCKSLDYESFSNVSSSLILWLGEVLDFRGRWIGCNRPDPARKSPGNTVF